MTYEYLRPFIFEEGKQRFDSDNLFYPVAEEEIKEAERRIGYHFPSELKEFYKKIGCGFLRRAANTPKENYIFYDTNRINGPLTNADIFLNGSESGLISEDTYELLAPDDLPFFEMYDSSYFMVMKLDSDNPNAVWTDTGVKIEDSFERFIWRLYYESPSFYDSIIEDHYKKLTQTKKG